MAPGGMTNVQAANDDARAVAAAVKAAVEGKTGKSYSKFDVVSFATQVVAGVNYFLKVDVGHEHVHVRVFKDLQQNTSVHSVQEGKQASDALTYF